MKYFGFFIVTLLLLSCNQQHDSLHIIQGEAFGTVYSIKYYDEGKSDIKAGVDAIVTKVNESVSTYLPDSDISKINRGDSTIVIDSIFREVYLLSEEVYRKSDGYFDPTIGVLRNAYGFGDEKALKKIDSTTLDSLMQFVGFDKVKLKQDGTIQKASPEIYFDFNAIAKGYGIDRIGAYLDEEGISNYLIELGGELLAKGTHIEKESPWKVGIEKVDSELGNRAYSVAIPLQDKAMASSGNYRKYRIDSVTGQKFVHTIDPTTGSALQSDVTSATVLAKTCAEADAYATTFMTLGLERSKQLLSTLPHIDAYLTYNDAEGKQQVFVSPGFQKLL
ncbi:FAD:protein FMN transferase [Flavobacteriaceae bacterium TK19130]|nr:FAD:protein FMN transferase [Thermobacterium salinum]